MSYVAMDWAMPKIIADVNAKSCLAVLAFHHNKDTGLCCPSIATIAAEMGVKSQNTVRKSIKSLEEMGLLKSSRVLSERGEIVRTEYVLNLESLAFLPEKKEKGVVHVVKEGHDVKEVHEMNDGGSSHEGCPSSGEGGVVHVVRDVLHVVNPNKEYNKEEEQGSKQVIPTTAENEPNETPSMFEDDQSIQKKKARDPVVKLPEQLPEDWRKDIVQMRPDLDVDKFWLVFRTKNQRVNKALKNWHKTILNWAGRETICVKKESSQTNQSKAFNPSRSYYEGYQY